MWTLEVAAAWAAWAAPAAIENHSPKNVSTNNRNERDHRFGDGN
jgi:hypothetical protein